MFLAALGLHCFTWAIENYKTLMKEIKDDTDGDLSHVLGLEESIL